MFHKRGESGVEIDFFSRHKFWIAVATLVGTIIGAGILGIPYVVAKAGFLYGLILMVVIGIAFLYLNLFLGEIVLRTKEQHQLPGYAGKYLGTWGKRLMTLSMFIGLYGALTAYLIGEGVTLHAIFKAGIPLYYTLLYFGIGAYIIYRGVKSTGNIELLLILLLCLAVLFIGIFSFDHITLTRLSTWNLTYFFLPYGVILFAYIGSPCIPELQELLEEDRRKMKQVIMVGSLLPILLYLLFTAVIVGIIGLDQFELLEPNQRIATVALSIYSQPLLGLLANILAVLSMFTSFLTLGIALIEIYQYDYGFSRKKAWLLALAVPLLISVSGFTTFITVLGISGAVGGGLDGILIVLMYWRARKSGDRHPEYSLKPQYWIGVLLILLFTLGIVYHFLL